MRRAARIDDNHGEIVKAFRQAGCSVKPVHTLKNFVDLIVAKNGVNVLIEVKDGKKSPSRRKLTDGEKEFQEGWKGLICLVESVDDVEKVLKTIGAAA